ncbi:DsbA family protein [Paracoccus contaminans]|uniref:Disulfide bond formation protein DsbA n=1 Tax=Paracoccus contaminans TaxID=1945662 RepID=A0A1W6CUP0_9RHOB|nr:DsbA family protein [Paracoccus contaminans]ARJ68570.1 disulfide bond formation protein DsbA [Paracoccus contaminans]
MKSLLTAAALMAASALPLSVQPAAAFDPASMTEAEKTAFGEAVRDYIMSNPQVLVEAVNQMEAQRLADESKNDKALVAANRAEIMDDGRSWVGGNPKGDLTMVEFIDYRCGYCRKVASEVDEVVAKDGNIRLILKEFPILGRESELASRYAIAVKQTAGADAYKAAHDKLYAMRGEVTMESLGALAAEQGLDAQAITRHMNSEAVTAEIRANRQLAEKMQIMGTPTFVIGPELLRGIPSTGMTAAIEQIRKGAQG